MRISKISAIHYGKLVFRSALLVWAAVTYLVSMPVLRMRFQDQAPRFRPLLVFVWAVFAVEMALRFFPSRLESMGCQKQFARNYDPDPAGRPGPFADWRRTAAAAASWVVLNGGVGWLYLRGVIDDGVLLLVSLFYAVSDMICILFFCPFQSWILGNRCCTTCRIYNWDYLMMFTPLIFVRSFYTWSLVAMGAALLVRWELALRRHPERFDPARNRNLRCAQCTEKLCTHKKQLRRLWSRQRDRVPQSRVD